MSDRTNVIYLLRLRVYLINILGFNRLLILNKIDLLNLEIPNAYKPCALTIGNFDGCHLGHQELILQTLTFAQECKVPSVAISFDPLPEEYFKPQEKRKKLFTLTQKIRALKELGIDFPLIQNFYEDFTKLTHQEFYQKLLKNTLGVKAISIGENFRFGFKREGTASWLKTQSELDQLRFKMVPMLTSSDTLDINSSRIRKILSVEGDVSKAYELLGRPYMLEGVISQGDKLGRKLGFPTANLTQIKQLLPLSGVYAGYTWLSANKDESHDLIHPKILPNLKSLIPTVFHIGDRPTMAQYTFDETEHRIEAHFLDHEPIDELYGFRAGYYLTHRVRENRKLPNLEELKAHIKTDVLQARKLLS